MPTTYVSRISQWIEKRYNAKGGNVITDVDPSAIVQLPVLIGVEERYGQGWNTYNGSTDVAAVAAQFSRTLLRNPKGSNVLAVVEQIFSTLPFDYTMENGQPDLANVQPAGTFLRRLDSRSGFTDSTCVLSSDTNATAIPGAANVLMKYFGTGTAVVQAIVTVNQEIPILPGDGLWFVSDAVNTRIAINLRWRERALEQSELT